MAFAQRDGARLSLIHVHDAAGFALTLRTARSHTPKGRLTLRFDPGRLHPKPAACYRASWQLPGPDLPRQATTSLCWISYSISTLQLWAHSRPSWNFTVTAGPGG